MLKKILNPFDYFYYSRVISCKASGPNHKGCKCWHKAGTGPYHYVAQLQEDVAISYVAGEVFKVKLTWKKQLNYHKVFIYFVIASLIVSVILHGVIGLS